VLGCFELDGGVYVQSKYGAHPLPTEDKYNAGFVIYFRGVTAVLEAFYVACATGEFDAVRAEAAKRKQG
jgi:hypothetical protein